MSSKIEQTAREIVEIMGNEDMLVCMDTRTLEQLLIQLKKEVHAADNDPNNERYRIAAKNEYQDPGRIEIDDDAVVSKSEDDGAYVQAWVYIEL